MKKQFFLPFITSLFLIACQHEEVSDDLSSVLTAFDVSLSPANNLRAEVSVNFKETTSYHIEYWEKADKNILRNTKSITGQGPLKQTLILLKPETHYVCRVVYGDGIYSDVKEFVTKSAPIDIAHATLLVNDMSEELPGYLLLYMRKSPGFIYMLDAKGIPVWYESVPEGVLVANLDHRTNYLYMITKPVQNTFNEAYTGRILKVMDLWGKIILEKELETIPEMAGRKAHHECRPLPNGDVIFVTTVDRTFDLSTQGGSNKELVTGDGFMIMDLKGNVLKKWDCFDTLNPTADPQIMGIKEDWLHANSINFDADGNYYMTFNRTSELWKIDAVSGKVLYRVGRNGNVSMPVEGYADGMHCANPQTPDKILVLDNARNNTRGMRALMYKINPQTNTAELILNCEMPKQYSTPNRGSVQMIGNDMLVFGSSVKNLVLFTDCSRQAKVLRAISLSHLCYRAEYIPSITY